MLSVVGTYENGHLTLDKDYITKSPVKVIVTFLEEVQTKSEDGLALTDFSFSESKKNLQKFKGSFASSVIDERRTDV
jgi:hypothetical protein